MSNAYDVERGAESPKSNTQKKNTSRAKQLTTTEKKKLAALIRHREVLWNPEHPSNKDSRAHERAWREVANELLKPMEMCRQSWKSLKDCYRYRRKVGEKMRDNGEIQEPLEYVESNWEFAQDMAFLSGMWRPKGRYITYTEESEVYNEADEHDDSSGNSYSIKQELNNIQDPIESIHENKKRRVEVIEQDYNANDGEETTTEYAMEAINPSLEPISPSFESTHLVNQLGKLVQAQTEFMREFKKSSAGNFNFKTQLIAVDALLQQLPKQTAEKTLVEMQNYVLKKVNEYQRNKSDEDF